MRGDKLNIAFQKASGVGGMLPSVAISLIPLPGMRAVGAASFGLCAAGQATEEAVNSGAGLQKATGYGTLSGLVELGVEMASGGIGGSSMGKVLGKQVGKSALGRAATTFVGEGLEEVASDIIDPGLKRLTGVDKNANINFNQLPNTFLVGGLTGLAMGGASKVASNVSNINRGRAKATNADISLNYIK